MIVLALLYALPCGLAILLRSAASARAAYDALEFGLIFNLLPHALAPLTPLLYAAGIVQDEIEEQTLTYLLLALRAALGDLCGQTRGHVLRHDRARLVGDDRTLRRDLRRHSGLHPRHRQRPTAAHARDHGSVQVGYCSIFGFIGLIARRSLIVGLVFIVLVEGFLANLDFILCAVTIVHYVRTLVVRWLDLPVDTLSRMLRDWSLDMDTLPTTSQAVQRLVLTGVIGTALAAWWFARREFRVKTPEGN